MNANQVHLGHKYAIQRYPPRPKGATYTPNARCVVVYRKFGEILYGKSNQTMFVEGFELDPETEQPLSTEMRKYRIRDILNDWDEYEDERDQKQAEQEKWEREYAERRERERQEYEKRERERQQRIENERKERERKAAEQRERAQKLRERLSERGLDPISIHIDYNTGKVEIAIVELERWLNSLTKTECVECGQQFIMIPKEVYSG